MQEKLREIAGTQYGQRNLGLTDGLTQRASELLPRILKDCMRPSETWPPYMPDLSARYAALPDWPWKRSLWGQFTFEAILVAARIARGDAECPPELAA
jgi:hypothetical protein